MTESELATNYFNLLLLLGTLAMTWWAAGTAVCGTILKLTLEHKSSEYSIGLALIVGIFFMLLTGFGLFCSSYITSINQGILGLLPLDVIQKGNVANVLESMNVFYLFPCATFVIMGLAWLWVLRLKGGE